MMMGKNKESWAVAVVTNRQEVDGGRVKDSYKLSVSEHHGCTQAEAVGAAAIKALSGQQGFMIALLQATMLHMPQPEAVDLSATIDLSKVAADKQLLADVLKWADQQSPDKLNPVLDALSKLSDSLHGRG